MLAAQENRFQYVYFALSALVATAMLVLVYISMRSSLVSLRGESPEALPELVTHLTEFS